MWHGPAPGLRFILITDLKTQALYYTTVKNVAVGVGMWTQW